MAIYKYTVKKYAKSYSTWIIMLITAIIILFISGILPFVIWSPDDVSEYSRTVLILIPNVTIFLAIFSSVFSGFKSATMFKDEVEDGTFLIILSKPISRSKILIYKWLALQTFLFFYSIFASLCFASTLAIFDTGNKIVFFKEYTGLKTLRENFFTIFFFISIILYIMSLTFSSIAIFLSTKLSVSSTVGISIALGIVIPITALVRTFTHNQENLLITSQSKFKNIYNKKTFESTRTKKSIETISNDIQTYKNVINELTEKNDLIKKLFENEDLKKFLNKFDTPEKIQNRLKKHKKNIEDLHKDPKSIYNLSINLDKEDQYKNLWFLDTNFQIKKLTSLVYDRIIPPHIQNDLFSDFSRFQAIYNYNVVTKSDVFNKNKKTEESIKKFDEYVEYTWNKTKELRADFLTLWLLLLYKNREKIQERFTDRYKRNFPLIMAFSNVMQKFNPEYKYYGEKYDFTNYNFYIYFLKVINIIRKSEKQNDMENIKKIAPFITFADVFYYNFPYDSKNLNFDYVFFYLSSYVKRLLLPLDIWVKNVKELEKLSENLKWKSKEYIYKNSVQTKIGDISEKEEVDFKQYQSQGGVSFSTLFSYYLLKPAIKGEDIDTKISQEMNKNDFQNYYWLNFLIKQKRQFNKTEKKEYATKYLILSIFLAVSISLIPLAYLFVRKKDFR